MFLRRAIQVSTVLLYWFVIVPVIAKYLTDAKWMRKTKWTRKKVGFYGIAAFAFIFVYFVAMYAYVCCKRWEREILADVKQQRTASASTSKHISADSASATTLLSTADAQTNTAAAAPKTRGAAFGTLVRIRPARPPPPPLRITAAVVPTSAQLQAPGTDQRYHHNYAYLSAPEDADTGAAAAKLKIVRAAPKLPAVHRSLPLTSMALRAPAVAAVKVTAASPLVEEHPLATELDRRQRTGNRAERLTAELADILRRYYRISTGSVQAKANVEKV